MPRRRRLRTFTLWTGTLLCVLIAAAFVVSGWWFVALQVPTPYGPCLYLCDGSIAIVMGDVLHDWAFAERKAPWGSLFYKVWKWDQRHVELPLYGVFATVAIPTLLVWWSGRKPIKPGHCECGYDVTGNTSGKCPEFGEAV